MPTLAFSTLLVLAIGLIPATPSLVIDDGDPVLSLNCQGSKTAANTFTILVTAVTQSWYTNCSNPQVEQLAKDKFEEHLFDSFECLDSEACWEGCYPAISTAYGDVTCTLVHFEKVYTIGAVNLFPNAEILPPGASFYPYYVSVFEFKMDVAYTASCPCFL